MNIQQISSQFQTRLLNSNDINCIYRLCCSNPIFYQYHPPFVTKESIAEIFTALPPNKTLADKFFFGFFQNNQLLAIMDLVFCYPDTDTVYIGLFMVDCSFQNKGIGSAIIQDCIALFKSLGYSKIRLASDCNNPQSNTFWEKNQFIVLFSKQNYLVREYTITPS